MGGSFVMLFLGPSWQMIRANRDLSIYNVGKARQGYETLAKHFPKLPQVSYNLGIYYYRLGEYQAARHRFEEALHKNDARLKRGSTGEDRLLQGMIYYHLGNIAFKSASAVKDETSKLKLFQEALEYYKKTLQAIPRDMEAKYNYELALLHISHSNQGGGVAAQTSKALEQITGQTEEYLNQSVPSEPVTDGDDW